MARAVFVVCHCSLPHAVVAVSRFSKVPAARNGFKWGFNSCREELFPVCTEVCSFCFLCTLGSNKSFSVLSQRSAVGQFLVSVK